MAPKGHRRDLDELLEATEREIEALIEFWENCFVDENEGSSPEIPWISKWHPGCPLDLNDEYIQEDPSYNEERVEQEALEDYLKEQEEERAPAAVEQAAGQKRDAANSRGVEDKSPPPLPGKLTACTKALASLSQGRPPTRKKPHGVILSVTGEAEAAREETRGESGSPSSSSEEEEAANLLRKMPKRGLQCRASGMGNTHTGNPRDRSEQLRRWKQKVSGHCRRNPWRPVAAQTKQEQARAAECCGQPSPRENEVSGKSQTVSAEAPPTLQPSPSRLEEDEVELPDPELRDEE